MLLNLCSIPQMVYARLEEAAHKMTAEDIIKRQQLAPPRQISKMLPALTRAHLIEKY